MTALTLDDINRLALDASDEDRRRRMPGRVIQPQRSAHTAPEDPDPPTILLGGRFKLEGLEIEGPGGRVFECAYAEFEQSPLNFMMDPPSQMGGRGKAKSHIRELLKQGLGFDSFWACTEQMLDGHPFIYPETAIHWLSRHSSADAEWIDILAQMGGDVNQVCGRGLTPLQHASGANNLLALEALKARGAGLQHTRSGGHTELHFAAEGNAPDVMEALLAMGADINAQSLSTQMTPLIMAIVKKSDDAMRKLIELGADLDLAMDGRQSPIHVALSNGNLTGAVVLVESGVDVDCDFGGGKSWKDVAVNSVRDRFDSFLRSRKAQIAAREALHDMGLAP